MNTNQALAGIGLRGPHVAHLLERQSSTGWLEVHPENYMGSPAALGALLQLRRRYPVSFHCVGLSLGSADGIAMDHLQRVVELSERVEPVLVSDHLSWSRNGRTFLHDLLPLPYTREALDVVSDNVDRAQERLRRTILVENPSLYLGFRHSDMGEPEFLNALAERTGCSVLLDVNNVYVSCANVGGDPYAYLDAIARRHVGEIHLAGHAEVRTGDGVMLIDNHGSLVSPAVWDLYRAALRRFGPVRTLVEWDSDLPPVDVLLGEAWRAASLISSVTSNNQRGMCHDIAA